MNAYGECVDSAYAMIAMAGKRDFSVAGIHRGVILSIDRANNTAEIIINEDCHDLLGADFSTVPFFYHCQDSDGGEENIANSHRAFVPGDHVYLLHVPGSADMKRRFFIIGHFDIRATKPCLYGPIATGEIRVKTTTIRNIDSIIYSGNVISDSTSSSRVDVQMETPTGTTEDVVVIDNGDGTQTTTITTISVSRERWERRLWGCVSVDDVFLPETPAHLLNARYTDDVNNDVASIVVWSEYDGTWHVLVERSTGDSPFYYSSIPATDDLWVSAALSRDLMHLYLVESRQSGPDRSAGWSRFAWDKYSGSWSLVGSGTVPKPVDLICPNRHAVDRDGIVRGFWASETTGRMEQDDAGDWCVGNGRDITREYVDHDPVYGGGWSIMTGSWVHGYDRGRGIALHSGDLYPVVEVPVSTTQLATSSEYTWTATMTGGDESTPWSAYDYTRHQDVLRDTGLRFDLQVGGGQVAITREYGEYLVFAGDCAIHDEQDVSDGVHLYFSRDTSMTFTAWEHLDGSVSAAVTAGGWVTTYTAGGEDVVTDFSPIETSLGPVDHTIDAGSYYMPPSCPSLLENLLARVMPSEVDRRDILYPVALGACYSVDRSFSSVDQESGEVYVGAQVRATPGAASVWRIWHDDGSGLNEVTAEVAACIGRPLEQLAAIYWRAW